MAARELSSAGGYVLVEDGPRLWFIVRGGNAKTTAAFVLGLLALILGANAVLQVVLGLGSVVAGVIIGAGALATSAALAAVVRAIRSEKATPLERYPALVVLDRHQGVLLDGSGRTLAPLASVHFVSQMQLTSSSSALACTWPGGSLVVYRGSPFSGSIDEPLAALRQRGLA